MYPDQVNEELRECHLNLSRYLLKDFWNSKLGEFLIHVKGGVVRMCLVLAKVACSIINGMKYDVYYVDPNEKQVYQMLDQFSPNQTKGILFYYIRSDFINLIRFVLVNNLLNFRIHKMSMVSSNNNSRQQIERKQKTKSTRPESNSTES